MDRFFCFLLRTKSVLRLKNRSSPGKTDDFSSSGQLCPSTSLRLETHSNDIHQQRRPSSDAPQCEKSRSIFQPLKGQTKIAADDILIFYFYFSTKIIRIDFSCESSIHLKHQVLFSLKNSEKIFMNVICCSRDWHFKD